MKWNLMIDKGSHKGQLIPICLTPFLIGRDDDCQLRPNDPYVSHHHCALISHGNTLVLRDCQSTNGTFVNARKIKGEVELHPGDRLGIGPLIFVVSLQGQGAVNQQPPKPPPARSSTLGSEEAVAAILSAPATWLAILVVAIGFGLFWLSGRKFALSEGGWFAPLVDSSFGFESINRFVVRSTYQISEQFSLTQTGELNWNILGIVSALLVVLIVLWMGA